MLEGNSRLDFKPFVLSQAEDAYELLRASQMRSRKASKRGDILRL
jgi:hypothetical protein